MPRQKLYPLPAAAFQILLALAGEDLHGYGIMRQVEEQTGGRTRLGPGTLYTSIQGLLEEGLIEEVAPSGKADPSDERPIDARQGDVAVGLSGEAYRSAAHPFSVDLQVDHVVSAGILVDQPDEIRAAAGEAARVAD